MRKFENFCKALENLKDIFNYEEPYGNVEMTGIVGLFEICFEQAWKAMKEILESAGYSESQTGSPRQILKTAFAAGLIAEEALWLEALASRNNASHAYNQNVALQMIEKTKNVYYQMFVEFRQIAEASWMETNIQKEQEEGL